MSMTQSNLFYLVSTYFRFRLEWNGVSHFCHGPYCALIVPQKVQIRWDTFSEKLNKQRDKKVSHFLITH